MAHLSAGRTPCALGRLDSQQAPAKLPTPTRLRSRSQAPPSSPPPLPLRRKTRTPPTPTLRSSHESFSPRSTPPSFQFLAIHLSSSAAAAALGGAAALHFGEGSRLVRAAGNFAGRDLAGLVSRQEAQIPDSVAWFRSRPVDLNPGARIGWARPERAGSILRRAGRVRSSLLGSGGARRLSCLAGLR